LVRAKAAVCLFLVLLMADFAVAGNQVVELNSANKPLLVGAYLRIWEDPDQELTPELFRQLSESTEPLQINDSIPNFGFTQSAYWATLDVKADEQREWMLEILFPGLDYVSIYIEGVDGQLVSYATGRNMPFTERQVSHSNVAYRFHLAENKVTRLYFRFANKGTVSLPIYIGERTQIEAKLYQDHALKALFFGFMVAVILFNLILAFSVRRPSYVAYVAFQVLVVIHQASSNGLLLQYIWPSNPPQDGVDYNIAILLALSIPPLFLRHFMPESAMSKRMIFALYSVSITQLLMTYALTLGPLSGDWSPPYVNMLAQANVMIMLLISLYFSTRSIEARYFLVAWLAFAASIIVQTLWHGGRIPYNSITSNLDELLIVAEALIFSFGLGYQVRRLRHQNEQAKNKLVDKQVELIETLKGREQFKENLLSQLSHELKTPLTAIIGMADQYVFESVGESKHVDKRLVLMRNSGRRLSETINDVIALNDNPDTKLVPLLRTINVRDLVDDAIALIEYKLDSNNYTIEVSVQDGLQITTDDARLQQVVINLLDNALKYGAGGPVFIAASLTSNDSMSLTVTDTGRGISESDQKRIFKEFVQLDSERPGFGLGLSITKRLVDMLGGSIELWSEPDCGSEFRVTLGGAMAANSASATRRKVIGLQGGNIVTPPQVHRSVIEGAPTILVVDDEASNLALVKVVLGASYNLSLVSDPAQASKLIENNHYDLALIDVMMPRVSGLQLCANIRKKFDKRDLPVIMISAQGLDRDIQASFDAGANDYLTKPFTREEINARVESQLQYRQVALLAKKNKRLKDKIDKQGGVEPRERSEVLRKELFELLTRAVEIWVTATGKNEAELADETGLWRVSIDGSRIRARTLERYLSFDTLPKKPKWKLIVDTAYYIISCNQISADEQASISKRIERVIELRTRSKGKSSARII